MPKDDGLKRLPDHVVAPLLRALMCIPHRPDNRLILQRIDYPRPPSHDPSNDYNVIWRGQRIGRVWRHQYSNHPWSNEPPWHWDWRGVPGRADTVGHAPTLESVMADFRRAWDAPQSGVA